ncbi:YncE family protein [Micromonospora sp. CPCC 206061]|uniref:YncE family protein n=1 Tax=Micromonospora sp. CPCC 206061 TaxID=3122410 RepID=UPI002FF2C7F5
MTTRRAVLALALVGLAGCTEKRGEPTPARRGDQLFVETEAGLSVVDAGTGRTTVPAAPSVVTADWSQLARAGWTGTGTTLSTHRLPDGTQVTGGTLKDRLEARVLSPDGRLLALTNPSRPRSRTTLVVADSSGERVRLDLPGYLEPEAFDASGTFLFVLDYLPPARPDRYRVRQIDLRAKAVQPLSTRLKTAVPAGAEEEMRGEGRQAVYDPQRRQLFTLYTHQPDHLHTRELVAGARDDAPHVHAFVHALHLTERWAYCVDLPEPFGSRAAAGHAIALSADGSRLTVVDTTTGAYAEIDPAALAVTRTGNLPAPLDGGTAAAALTPDGRRLVVGAGQKVVVVPSSDKPVRWSTGSEVRGLALVGDSRVYVGQDGEVTAHDPLTGQVISRTQVPGLVTLRHAMS